MKKFIIMLMATVMVFSAMPSFSAMTEVSEGYTVGGKTYKLYRGVFSFPSEVPINGAMKDIPAAFFFS